MTHRTLGALFVVLCACNDKPAATSTSTPPSSSVAGAGVCTPGADQTCNDDPAMSSLHGTCNPDRTCTCKDPFVKNPQTGKCK